MKRIFVPSIGPDTEKLSKAIAISVSEAVAIGASTISIVTPLKNIDKTMIGEALGVGASKALMKGHKVPIEGYSVSLNYYSTATVPKFGPLEVILALHVPESDLLKLDDISSKCLVYLPWAQGEGIKWAAKWNAEIEGAPKTSAEVQLSVKVIAALETITSVVNLSSGIGDNSDKEFAKGKFNDLRLEGERWQSDEIEKWAVRNRWSAKHAKELGVLSNKSSK